MKVSSTSKINRTPTRVERQIETSKRYCSAQLTHDLSVIVKGSQVQHAIEMVGVSEFEEAPTPENRKKKGGW